jgi:hypothetical protein
MNAQLSLSLASITIHEHIATVHLPPHSVIGDFGWGKVGIDSHCAC